MAQLIEDLTRASSEIKRSPVRDAVKIIGRIISREFLARELLLHGRVRVKSKTAFRSASIAITLGVGLHASAVLIQPLARLARACLCNHPASSVTTRSLDHVTVVSTKRRPLSGSTKEDGNEWSVWGWEKGNAPIITKKRAPPHARLRHSSAISLCRTTCHSGKTIIPWVEGHHLRLMLPFCDRHCNTINDATSGPAH